MKNLLLALVVVMAGCSSTVAPTAPEPTRIAALTLSYDINVPTVALVQDLRARWPEGIRIAPLTAQTTWDFTSVYGVPNVYWGPSAPPEGVYSNTGIVVAPALVANMPTFTSRDWPGIGLDAGRSYVWEGHFTYTSPRSSR